MRVNNWNVSNIYVDKNNNTKVNWDSHLLPDFH